MAPDRAPDRRTAEALSMDPGPRAGGPAMGACEAPGRILRLSLIRDLATCQLESRPFGSSPDQASPTLKPALNQSKHADLYCVFFTQPA
jgi:hypothetical protein